MEFAVTISAFVKKQVYVEASDIDEATELAKDYYNDPGNLTIDVNDMFVEEVEEIVD